MSLSLRTQAETLAIALEIGALAVADVIRWAEDTLAAQSAPHVSICELVSMAQNYPVDVAHALREVPGELDEEAAKRDVLALLGRGLLLDRTRAEQMAAALYRMVIADELWDDELRTIAYWADDALELAKTGASSMTRDEVVDLLADALERISLRARSE